MDCLIMRVPVQYTGMSCKFALFCFKRPLISLRTHTFKFTQNAEFTVLTYSQRPDSRMASLDLETHPVEQIRKRLHKLDNRRDG